MPPRSHPTARQARLGAELRKLRERAGITGGEAAAFLGGERALVSHIESGRYGVSAERVRRLAAFYSATDRALVDALATMAEDRRKGWWTDFRGILHPSFLDLAELEYHASWMRTIQMLHIPGQFQTEEYAFSVFGGAVTEVPRRELEARVEHRLRRQQIFDRPTPPAFEALVHEAALRICYGERKAMRTQLDRLLEATDMPSVTIRVIPFTAEKLTGSAHSMLYAGGPIPPLDTVQVDSAFGGTFLDAEAQLAKYRALAESVKAVSLDADESRDIIHRIAQEM